MVCGEAGGLWRGCWSSSEERLVVCVEEREAGGPLRRGWWSSEERLVVSMTSTPPETRARSRTHRNMPQQHSDRPQIFNGVFILCNPV